MTKTSAIVSPSCRPKFDRMGAAMGMDIVEMVMEIEEEFDITIPNDVAPTLVTVGKLHAWVVGELHRLDRPLPAEQVFDRIREILSQILAIDVRLIRPGARFVDDLRMD